MVKINSCEDISEMSLLWYSHLLKGWSKIVLKTFYGTDNFALTVLVLVQLLFFDSW